jgi:hypothetical protein
VHVLTAYTHKNWSVTAEVGRGGKRNWRIWLSLPTCKAVFIGNNSQKSGFRRMASPCVQRRRSGGPRMGEGGKRPTANEKENK